LRAGDILSAVHELPLLVNIAMALAYALAGGLLSRRLGLPTIVGYLAAGVALGPLSLGYQADERAIQQFAEFGVILLMFGVGLHYSFEDLWKVRRVAIPGAFFQMLIVSVLGYLVARGWGYSTGAAWVFGIAISISSTVVLMRALMDRGWLEGRHGKIAIGWLVLEDLLTVGILVLLPVIASRESGPVWQTAGLAVGKALLFLFLMLVVGDRIVPAVLARIVNTRSRELAVLVALTVAVGTALASAHFFEVSLALGAFVAGIVVGESEFSHQIGADLLPFREAFAVMFFVSVGMLVNPSDIMARWDQVLIAILLIVVVKGLISGALAALTRCSGRTALILAAGRGQIGEFSFIVGQSGFALGLIDSSQYSVILAGAIGSITLNPLVMRLIAPAERALKRNPALWKLIDRPIDTERPSDEVLTNHVVIVGCGRVGRHIAEALGRLGITRIVIEADPERVAKLQQLGVPVMYGDASNSEIIAHSGLERARALVITLPDDSSALAVATAARLTSRKLQIIGRASTWEGARRLRAAGVDHVVRPELEGGVEIVRRTLLDLELPVREVQRYTELIRHDGLDESERPSAEQARVLDDLISAARHVEIVWLDIGAKSALDGISLAESGIRERAGVTVVAISRGADLIPNPGPAEQLHANDRIAVIGTPPQVAAVETLTH
jgi:monovalent cation:H+ antiporter-2, CPA2 family